MMGDDRLLAPLASGGGVAALRVLEAGYDLGELLLARPKHRQHAPADPRSVDRRIDACKLGSLGGIGHQLA